MVQGFLKVPKDGRILYREYKQRGHGTYTIPAKGSGYEDIDFSIILFKYWFIWPYAVLSTTRRYSIHPYSDSSLLYLMSVSDLKT